MNSLLHLWRLFFAAGLHHSSISWVLLFFKIPTSLQTLILDENREKASLIAERLGVPLESRLLQRNVDDRTILRSILSAWHPLGPSMFRAIVDICPSPLTAIDRARARYMLFGETGGGAGVMQSIISEVEHEAEEGGLKEASQSDNEEEDDSSAFPAVAGAFLLHKRLLVTYLNGRAN